MSNGPTLEDIHSDTYDICNIYGVEDIHCNILHDLIETAFELGSGGTGKPSEIFTDTWEALEKLTIRKDEDE